METKTYIIRNLNFAITILITANFLFSCKKAIEVNTPISGLVSSSVYSSDATAASVLTGIFENMMQSRAGFSGGNSSITIISGLTSDELKNYSTNVILTQSYKNQLTSANIYFWKEIYQDLYMTNSAIENLTGSNGVSNSLKQQLLGEAKFMRAFLYFYAINLFGDVPFVTSTNYKINDVLSRTPKDAIYQQVIADLKEAKTLLSTDFHSELGAIVQERIRPNKGAASALLSRVYLYVNDWANAESEATNVINNQSSYQLISNPDSVFLKNSNEAIWQLAPVVPGYNTFDGFSFILKSAPNSVRPVAISSNLKNSFEPGDRRLTSWVGKFTSGSNSYYFPNKYKVQGGVTGTPITEYLMVLRLAEQYLIRAEARAQQNNIMGSQADLNMVRNRASLPNTGASDKNSLLSAILQERKVELFTEWGHRWFDLKRTNTIDAVMSVVAPQKGGTWDVNWALFPIPKSEILVNPNLIQNPGYN